MVVQIRRMNSAKTYSESNHTKIRTSFSSHTQGCYANKKLKLSCRLVALVKQTAGEEFARSTRNRSATLLGDQKKPIELRDRAPEFDELAVT